MSDKPITVMMLNKRCKIKFLPKVLDADGEVVHGTCDAPGVKNRSICIDKKLTGEKRVEIILHECLHFCDWWRDEMFVEVVAHDLTRILTRLYGKEAWEAKERIAELQEHIDELQERIDELEQEI